MKVKKANTSSESDKIPGRPQALILSSCDRPSGESRVDATPIRPQLNDQSSFVRAVSSAPCVRLRRTYGTPCAQAAFYVQAKISPGHLNFQSTKAETLRKPCNNSRTQAATHKRSRAQRAQGRHGHWAQAVPRLASIPSSASRLDTSTSRISRLDTTQIVR